MLDDIKNTLRHGDKFFLGFAVAAFIAGLFMPNILMSLLMFVVSYEYFKLARGEE